MELNKTFIDGLWSKEINVTSFVQTNITPYLGDASFLAGPTERILYGVYNRPISISIITNMQEFNIGISMAYGVLVIAICYVALGIIFKLDKKRFI